MICSSVKRFFMSNLLVVVDWTLKSGATQFRGDVGIITEFHTRRERDQKLRDRLLSSRHTSGKLFCEMCGTPPLITNVALREAHFEAHHVVPLSSTGTRTTRLSDLALLCANCHRLLHRAIAIEKRWLSVAEGKVICGV